MPEIRDIDRLRYLKSIDLKMALCYERLSQRDRALTAFRRVLAVDAVHAAARAGEDRMLIALGQKKRRASNPLSAAVQAVLGLPKEERDWSIVEQTLTRLAEENQWADAQIKLFDARLLLWKGEFQQAIAAADAWLATKPQDVDFHLLACEAARQMDDEGPDAVLKRLDLADAAVGEHQALRVARAIALR